MGLFCFLVLHKLGGLYQDRGSHVWVLLLQLGGQIMTLLTLQVNKTLHWSWVFFFKVHCNLGFCRGGDVVISHLILIWRLCFYIFFVDINTCIFIDFEMRDLILLKKIILMVRCIHTCMDALKNPIALFINRFHTSIFISQCPVLMRWYTICICRLPGSCTCEAGTDWRWWNTSVGTSVSASSCHL